MAVVLTILKILGIILLCIIGLTLAPQGKKQREEKIK